MGISEQSQSYPRFGKRHVLALWVFSGFIIVFISRVSLNIAIVQMVNNTAEEIRHPPKISNNTEICPFNKTAEVAKKDGEFDWDKDMQGIILGSFYYGYICTQIIGGILPRVMGSRLLFGLSIGGSGLLSLIHPIAARTNVDFFIALRVISGIIQGVLLPSSAYILQEWAPKKEKGFMVSFPLTGPHIGTVLAAPLTALLCEHGFDSGWPSTFYVFGGLCVLWSLGWFYFIRDTPAKHPTISTAERKYIEENCEISDDPIPLKQVPWRSIFFSPAVWAVSVAQACHGWNFDTLLIEVSTYLNDVLHLSASLNGLMASLPYLCVWIIETVSGFLADFLVDKGVKPIYVRKGMYGGGMIASAVLLISIGFVGCNVTAVILLLCLSVGVTGFGYVGFVVNHTDIAPPYVGITMGIANTLAQLPGIISPLITAQIITEQSTVATWQIVFYISCGVSVFGTLVFILVGDGRVQKWAETKPASSNLAGHHELTDVKTAPPTYEIIEKEIPSPPPPPPIEQLSTEL